MKSMTLFILLFSQLTFATETDVVITPSIPTGCTIVHSRLIDWVYDVRKVSETSQEATFTMITMYGSCKGNQIISSEVFGFSNLSVVQNGVVWPWQRQGIKSALTKISKTEMQISIVFDKTILFKKAPKNNLQMDFKPTNNLTFRWFIETSLKADGTMKIIIE